MSKHEAEAAGVMPGCLLSQFDVCDPFVGMEGDTVRHMRHGSAPCRFGKLNKIKVIEMLWCKTDPRFKAFISIAAAIIQIR